MRGWFGAGRRTRATAVVLLAGVVAVAIVVVVVSKGGGSNAAEPVTVSPTTLAAATRTSNPSPTAAPTPIRFAGILDGVAMSETEWLGRKDLLPLAVMIDNTVDANPQAGLDKADLIYEAFVEGGITRLMAVYWRQEAAKVLPVRSARTPFVVWASELGALYAHAGGASTGNEANAVGQIFEWGIKDLEAFAPVSDRAYYRDADRQGPHDLATSTASLREAAATLGFVGPSSVASWPYRSPGDSPLAGTAAEGIEIDFQGSRTPWQLVQWKWDAPAGAYARYQFGGRHVDAVTGQQLHFTTVVVMETLLQVVDDSGHVLLDQFGSGKATVFMDGKAIDAVWRKADRAARTTFYSPDGREIAFERGAAFIEVIGPASKVSFGAKADDLPAMPAYTPPPPSTAPEETPGGDLPTPTAVPSRTATPAASQTPSGSQTPKGSLTPAGSATPQGSATTGGTLTPAPSTPTPVPTPSPQPTIQD